MTTNFGERSDPEGDAYRRVAMQFKGKGWYDEIVAGCFEGILRLCREHDIRIVLVRFPLSAAYWRQMDSFLRTDEWEAKVSNLLADEDIVLLDHHDLYSDREDLFMDPDHLNMTGVQEFSSLVARELRDQGVLGPE